MKKLLILLLCIFIVSGCASNKENKAKDNQTEVIQLCTDFFNALHQSDLNKAASYCEEEYEEDLLGLIPDSFLDLLKEYDFSDEAVEQYGEYRDYFEKKIYSKVSNFNASEYYEDEDYFEVEGFIDTLVITDFSDLIFYDQLDDEVYAEIDKIEAEKGIEESNNYLMNETVKTMYKELDYRLENTITMNNPVTIYLTKTDDGYKIFDIFGMFMYQENRELIDYNSHGIYTSLDDRWQYDDDHMVSSTYAVYSDSFNDDALIEIHFTEQEAQVNDQEAYTNYAKNRLIEDVRESFSDYDTCEVESVAVMIDDKQYYGARVYVKSDDFEFYELDIPIYTNDGNVTMLAIVSYFEDCIDDVLKLIHID